MNFFCLFFHTGSSGFVPSNLPSIPPSFLLFIIPSITHYFNPSIHPFIPSTSFPTKPSITYSLLPFLHHSLLPSIYPSLYSIQFLSVHISSLYSLVFPSFFPILLSLHPFFHPCLTYLTSSILLSIPKTPIFHYLSFHYSSLFFHCLSSRFSSLHPSSSFTPSIVYPSTFTLSVFPHHILHLSISPSLQRGQRETGVAGTTRCLQLSFCRGEFQERCLWRRGRKLIMRFPGNSVKCSN